MLSIFALAATGLGALLFFAPAPPPPPPWPMRALGWLLKSCGSLALYVPINTAVLTSAEFAWNWAAAQLSALP